MSLFTKRDNFGEVRMINVSIHSEQSFEYLLLL